MEIGVSIIIPVYNRELFLQKSIESVLNQTYNKFEIIVVDDFSYHSHAGIVKNYNDSRLKFYRNSLNMGVSYSRNFGIKKSAYDFIAFLDSDDVWKPEKIEKQILFFKKNPDMNLVHTDEVWIRNGKKLNKKKYHKIYDADLFIPSLERCLISPSSVMLKKDIFSAYGYFDEKLPVCEDYDMWLRILSCEKVGFIDNPCVCKYGGHEGQLSKKYHSMDRFRVSSLIKLYNTHNLNDIYKKAVIDTILKKSTILLNGALKRDKLDDIIIYKKWIEDFGK